jgi:tetratricopeptide (TPR) repeat protein
MKEAAYAEILRMIKEEEPPKPSTRLSDSGEALASISANRHTEPAKLSKLMRGELDWIVMKTLEKDRNRRYETANAFAADVQRYLNDETVQACPPSAGYRIRKFVRRNKVALITIATVTVALLAGTILSTWQAIRATRAEELAEKRLLAERDARHDAEINFGRARDAVKRMLTRVAQEELADVPWMEPVRKVLLEDALQFYEQLLAERTTDPEIRLATAHARLDLGWINGRYGETAQQQRAIRLALELLEPLVTEYPENLHYRAGLARALHHQGHETAWNKKRWKEAERLLRRAIELQESVVASAPDADANSFYLSEMVQLLGNALTAGGQSKEAEAIYRRVVSIGERMTAKCPNDPHHLRTQVRGLTSIAGLLSEKDPAQAEELLLRAQALAVRFQAAGRKTNFLFDASAHTVAEVDKGLGNLYHAQGRTKEAQAAFRRAVEVYQKYTSDFPSLRFYRERLAWASNRLADALTDPADREEAERFYRVAVEAHEKLVADFPKDAIYYQGLSHAYRGLGGLLERAKRPEEAEQRYRQAAKLFQSVAADPPVAPKYRSNLGHTFARLATLYWDDGNSKKAEEAARQSLAIFDKLVTDFPDKAAYRQSLANMYQWQLVKILVATGQAKEAEKVRGQALAIWQKLAADYPGESQYCHKSGALQNSLAQHKDATISFSRAIELDPDSWESWHGRGIAFSSLGRWDEAVADQTKAIELKPDHPWSWHQRGLAQSRLGHWDKAVADHSKAIELKPDYWQAYHERGWPLGKLGQWDKAIADQTKALELNPKHWWTWSRRGDGYSALKHWDQAVADYTKAIALGAAEPRVWVSKAAAHAQLNQPDKAMTELRQALGKGFRNVKQLKNRSDLAGLRSREDFKQLLWELEAKKK